jgi:beta-hydroxylase
MKTAFFSILSPGKHIPAHRGPYKGVIRVHLGLKVPGPKEQCRIRVGNDYRHWEEGEVMLFDDTHDHEVWNDTDGERVVLFLDVVRPLAPPLDRINGTVISLIGKSPFVQNAKKNQEQWERKLASDVGPASVLA